MSGCRGEKTGYLCPLAGAPRLEPGKETVFQLVTVELSSRRVRWWYCDSLGGIPVFFPPTELKNRVNSDIIVKAGTQAYGTAFTVRLLENTRCG